MTKTFPRKLAIYLFLMTLLLPTQSFALNDIIVMQGKIVSANKQHSKKIGTEKFTSYILRIKKVNGRDSIPLFLTAEISVKEDSFNDEIIHVAKSKRNTCQFSLSRRGMRYYVHEIFLLEGNGFGKNIIADSDESTVQLSDNAVYHDESSRTVINNRKSLKNSASYGETGVSIGGQ
jgi:hypothetical protein